MSGGVGLAGRARSCAQVRSSSISSRIITESGTVALISASRSSVVRSRPASKAVNNAPIMTCSISAPEKPLVAFASCFRLN
jgi:hypothetical protein